MVTDSRSFIGTNNTGPNEWVNEYEIRIGWGQESFVITNLREIEGYAINIQTTQNRIEVENQDVDIYVSIEGSGTFGNNQITLDYAIFTPDGVVIAELSGVKIE